MELNNTYLQEKFNEQRAGTRFDLLKLLDVEQVNDICDRANDTGPNEGWFESFAQPDGTTLHVFCARGLMTLATSTPEDEPDLNEYLHFLSLRAVVFHKFHAGEISMKEAMRLLRTKHKGLDPNVD
tara:strand:+ start:233 stop:610 length:378 start_codon:yes stop_codon:yes gene_type:complete